MTDAMKNRFRSLDSLTFPHDDGPPEAGTIHSGTPSHRARRVGTVMFALLLTGIAFAFALRAFTGGVTEPRPAIRPPDSGVARPGTCDFGPWIKYCPEAEWARSVAAAAGLAVVDEKTVLIIGTPEGREFQFWAMDPAIHGGVTPLSEAIANGDNFVAAGHVNGVAIYSLFDEHAFVWSSHGLNVWVNEEIIGVLPPRSLVVALVRAAESIPYTSGEPPSTYRQCRAPTVRPSYLPWIKQGEPIPGPTVSYDAEIDRAQLSWTDPNYPEGRVGVGLTLSTHDPLGNLGEPTDIVLDGVAGHLHRSDEGGLVSISWIFNPSECNFMELVLADPDSSKRVSIAELMKIARSLT